MRITGQYDETTWWGEVRVDGQVLDPRPSQKVFNHSPDGFAWSYAGSGPAQLALAILLHAGLPKGDAVRWHQSFKTAFVQHWPRASFDVTVDVEAWITLQKRNAIAHVYHHEEKGAES